MSTPEPGPAPFDLADWRRRVADLYARVRADADPAWAHRHWIEGRERLFRDHPCSPLPPHRRAGFSGLTCFDYDPTWRLVAGVVPLAGPSVEADLGRDGRIRFFPIARTRGLESALGRELTIYRIEGYGGGLFLPFADASAGSETYGGGRYLYDTIKGADLGASGSILIADFNFAYNPSCSYSPDWVCPLAPPENHVPNPVRAGERTTTL